MIGTNTPKITGTLPVLSKTKVALLICLLLIVLGWPLIKDLVLRNPVRNNEELLFAPIATEISFGFDDSPGTEGDNDVHLVAIRKLEQIGTPSAVRVLRRFLLSPTGDGGLKRRALLALARIGTYQSIQAIADFEDWGQSQERLVIEFPNLLRRQPDGIWRLVEDKPLATCTTRNGDTWGVFWWCCFHEPYFWLSRRSESGQWSSPVARGRPEDWLELWRDRRFQQEKFTLKPFCGMTEFQVSWDHRTLPLKVSDIGDDTDLDSLPDYMEEVLTTDVGNPDTDGDGIPDGEDSNPKYSGLELKDDSARIRQAVLTFVNATMNSNVIYVLDPERDDGKQPYLRSRGDVIPDLESDFTQLISINKMSDSQALASFAWWNGYMATLEKKHGKWVVVSTTLTMHMDPFL